MFHCEWKILLTHFGDHIFPPGDWKKFHLPVGACLKKLILDPDSLTYLLSYNGNSRWPENGSLRVILHAAHISSRNFAYVHVLVLWFQLFWHQDRHIIKNHQKWDHQKFKAVRLVYISLAHSNHCISYVAYACAWIIVNDIFSKIIILIIQL